MWSYRLLQGIKIDWKSICLNLLKTETDLVLQKKTIIENHLENLCYKTRQDFKGTIE